MGRNLTRVDIQWIKSSSEPQALPAQGFKPTRLFSCSLPIRKSKPRRSCVCHFRLHACLLPQLCWGRLSSRRLRDSPRSYRRNSPVLKSHTRRSTVSVRLQMASSLTLAMFVCPRTFFPMRIPGLRRWCRAICSSGTSVGPFRDHARSSTIVTYTLPRGSQ